MFNIAICSLKRANDQRVSWLLCVQIVVLELPVFEGFVLHFFYLRRQSIKVQRTLREGKG